ncbi:MAG: sigma 54-interacting transcriptional regulator [Nitrospirales bacterium]
MDELTGSNQYKALLDVSESIVTHRDLADLLHELSQQLPRIVPFNFLGLVLYLPERHLMQDHVIQSNVPADIQGGKTFALDAHPAGLVWETQQPLIIPDLNGESRFPESTALMKEDGIQSLCVVPLTTALRRLGALVFASQNAGMYDNLGLEFFQRAARLIAVGVDNVIHHCELTHERDRLKLLLEVNNTVVSALDLRTLIEKISQCLRKSLKHDYTSLVLYDPKSERMRTHILDFPGSKGFIHEGLETEIDDTPAGKAYRTGQPVVADLTQLQGYRSDFIRLLRQEGIQSVCAVPLSSPQRLLGTLNVGTRQEHGFPNDEVALLAQVANQIALAVDNALSFQKVTDLKDRLAEEKLYLEEEIRTDQHVKDILGESAALKEVLDQLKIVAPTDSTVLVQGETGTGKELMARALHDLSGRKGHTFVKLNCAAIPTGLLESELFGHERGAFTGAIAQKVGRFELAHQGTIFLDEIGEVPLELQSKLLRVLQEQEFERLGSTRTIRVDVRLVAATNRDLLKMVEDNEFRGDLYYRLNVFPITVPPLRERPEDIPLLVRYFAQQYARKMNKAIETIPTKTMDILCHYAWPGNVRELENLIERSVILSQGNQLAVPLAELKMRVKQEGVPGKTLEANEREHILKVLGETNWVISGEQGAAIRLGMKRTTLQSKMKKLRIIRPG